MKYRKLPHGGEEISILGFGGSGLHEAGEKEAVETVLAAVDNGINYFDMAVSEAVAFDSYRTAFAGIRENIYLQMHFGADYTSGKYGWTTELDKVKGGMEWLLGKLGTDYIDFGFIHCLDQPGDLDDYIASGALDHVKAMKKEGIVRHIGLSSHTPALVNRVLDMGILDVVMFSVNPGYDYRHGEYAYGEVDERGALYRRCQAEGVGITVMKPFGGGQLLDAKLSPFKQALTETQCIQYALDTPGVLNVLPGIRNKADLTRVLHYLESSPEERDYSVIGSFAPAEAVGKCVYCSHCHPCPVGLDIALINKYYDLAKVGDTLAVDHYRKLDKHASDCIHCGHCDGRCPFRVEQSKRMGEIAAFFEN